MKRISEKELRTGSYTHLSTATVSSCMSNLAPRPLENTLKGLRNWMNMRYQKSTLL